MSRTLVNVTYNLPFQEAQRRIEGTLQADGFAPFTILTGENVWKKGEGIATGMKFIKVEYGIGQANLYGWIQVAALPGDQQGEESNLDGVAGVIPKKSVKQTIEKIQKALAS